jgi:hypothetical protein
MSIATKCHGRFLLASVQLFLIDYADRRRVQDLSDVRVVEGGDALTARLMPDGYKARPTPVHRLRLGCELSAAHSAAV